MNPKIFPKPWAVWGPGEEARYPTFEEVKPAIAELLATPGRAELPQPPDLSIGLNRSFAVKKAMPDGTTSDPDRPQPSRVAIGRFAPNGELPNELLGLELESPGSDAWVVTRTFPVHVSDDEWGFIPSEVWHEVAERLERLAQEAQRYLGLPETGIRAAPLKGPGGRLIGWELDVDGDELRAALTESDRAAIIDDIRPDFDRELMRRGWNGAGELRFAVPR